MNGEHVLVGLGYDDDGRPELDWAAEEAVTRNAPLHVVRAYDVSEVSEPWIASPGRDLMDELRERAETDLGKAVQHVRGQWPAVDVRTRATEGLPTAVLVEAARDAAVTVVGGRQLSSLGAAVLGSVSSGVAANASGPVVVVGEHCKTPQPDGAVVVGIDGSVLTEDVLRFAFEYAARRHRPLHAIACWQHTVREITPWPPALWGPEQAAAWLTEGLRGWREKFPEVPVHRQIAHGQPAPALVWAAAGQDLLVVGDRSKHAHLGALLGSVSHDVLHQARCPVAVIHPNQTP